MTAWVYVDESKRAGYVLAATTVVGPPAAPKVILELILPGVSAACPWSESSPVAAGSRVCAGQ